ncbi:MAG: AMP-binding protein [Planctomycetota bacterium]|jgi:acyl-CoA synthetase (AMP-forming)/AMP-acid ligase II|nr:AMP-binding protein [Planctomycetota bacterium]
MPENIACRLHHSALRFPEKPAVVICRGPEGAGGFTSESHSFADLERDSDSHAFGLLDAGVRRGEKALVMLKPSFAFFSCFFALLKIGAVPVLVDPGMGIRRLLECVRRLAPEALIGVPAAHAARFFLFRSFPRPRTTITTGRRRLLADRTWDGLLMPGSGPFPVIRPYDGELAAILFTTGSTGPAKGVEYDHAVLGRQIEILSRTFAITPEDRDLASFPGFSLFSIALGMTAVVPDIDPTRPGQAHPRNILVPIQEFSCTFSFGSPALWSRVSAYAETKKIRLPSLRRVVMAGAPVPAATHGRLLGGILPGNADSFTPYGATEVMPVACFTGREALAGTAILGQEGKGVCVGRPLPGVHAEIIRIDDGPIAEWDDSLLANPGEIGEIAIQANHASRHYHNLPDADMLAKITDGDQFWHRMGDLGYRDDQERLWLCGRKSHRVRTRKGDMFTLRCEAVFNRHPAVVRSALIGLPEKDGFARPAIIIEPNRRLGRSERSRLAAELFRIGRNSPVSAAIETLFFHPAFPTDIRHNAKIGREALAAWAGRHIRRAYFANESGREVRQ